MLLTNLYPRARHMLSPAAAGFLLLCSDGLFDGLEREQVFKIVKASGSQEEAARRLVAASELGMKL